jgi:hypothetical protein
MTALQYYVLCMPALQYYVLCMTALQYYVLCMTALLLVNYKSVCISHLCHTSYMLHFILVLFTSVVSGYGCRLVLHQVITYRHQRVQYTQYPDH